MNFKKILQEIDILILEYLENGGDPVTISSQLREICDLLDNPPPALDHKSMN